MALQTSGPISITDIHLEIFGTAPALGSNVSLQALRTEAESIISLAPPSVGMFYGYSHKTFTISVALGSGAHEILVYGNRSDTDGHFFISLFVYYNSGEARLTSLTFNDGEDSTFTSINTNDPVGFLDEPPFAIEYTTNEDYSYRPS